MDVDDVREQTFNAILDYQHAIIRVPAWGCVDVPAPYAYTAGRTMRQRPEIIVTGIEGEPATALLNELCLVDDVLGLSPGESLVVGGALVRVIEASPLPLHAAILQFGRIQAMQVLLPDVHNEFPDTLTGRTSLQPLIPVVPEDSWDPYDEENE